MSSLHPIHIFIGHDRRMPVLFHVLSHSILSRATVPVAITPLLLPALENILKRDLSEQQSTEFSFSRFLVPYLSKYSEWSLFLDNDMLVLDDINKLWEMRDANYAVQVIKHQHEPLETKKFLGEKQSCYARKNWSSVMLFNNEKCRMLTPEYINAASGLELHQFQWLDDALIGELPRRWNHLVDYDAPLPLSGISNLHYTSGGPYFAETRHCGYAEEWLSERAAMLAMQPHKLK